MRFFRRRPSLPPAADEWPDIFVRGTNGTLVTMMGVNARRLGDAIEAVIQGKAMIVLTGHADPLDRIWKRDDE